MNQKSSQNLRFSIVTVVFNGEKDIERTVRSCITQTYSNYEYIIIDGKSTDSTLDIINSFKISQLISEKDHGIYDAMNKAIILAQSDWILFMNCGDTFYDNNVLSNVAAKINKCGSNPDVIYGNTIYDYNNKYMRVIAKPIELINREMVFCHQSTFVKTSVHKKHLFDLRYKLAADYNLFFQLYKQNMIFQHIDILVAIFNQNYGSTLNNYKLSTKERFSIHSDSDKLINKIKCNLVILKIQLSLLKKKIISKKINNLIFNIKYHNKLKK